MDKLLGSLKSKTAYFALALVLVGAIEQNAALVSEIVGADNRGVFTAIVGVIVYVLRLVTGRPLEAK